MYTVRRLRSSLSYRAIKQNEQGAYYVDFAECNLCEACVPECPEDVMFVRSKLADTAWKCDLCGDCVAVCGTSALWIAEKEAVTA
jgi:Fe-S-cluster-containing hydrogenase component 2